MTFQPFIALFPKIGPTETRMITISKKDDALPPGQYGFIEFYCTDPKCDCRRVMIRVLSPGHTLSDPPWAVLSYGWEPKAFYKKWSKFMSNEEIEWFRGPGLDPLQPQSKYSETLLFYFKTMMLTDKDYVERLIRHYALFKKKIGMK